MGEQTIQLSKSKHLKIETDAAPKEQTWLRQAWSRFRRNRLAVFASFVLLAIILVAIVGPLVIDPDLALRPYPLEMLQEPSRTHILGTDEVGRDVAARLIFAGRVSLVVGLFTMLVAIGLGTLLGVTAGYYGGTADQILMRITDAMLSLPAMFVLLMIAAVVRPGVVVIAIVLGLLNWMDLARILRGQVLSLKKVDFVEAARASGANNQWIILRHMLPNLIGPIVVTAPLVAGRALLTESALSFLGLGIQPPIPSWGNMLNQAQQHLATAPGLAVSPGVMIILTVMMINFIGDGLYDAFDPRLNT